MIGPGREAKGGIASVINVYFDSYLSEKYNIVYISSYVDGSKIKKLFQFVKSLVRFFYRSLSSKVDIIHIHSASRASFYRKSCFVLFSKLLRKKVIFHIHGAEFNIFYHKESSLIKKMFIRNIMYLADIIIALSSSWSEDFEKIISDKQKIKVVSNSVGLPNYCREYTDKNNVNILFMGRLEKRKGVYDLVEIADYLISKKRGIIFTLCGDGDINKIRELVIKKGLIKFFEIPGWIKNKDKYFKKADIYVLPSYNEGLPMSVLEAASYGLPVVSTPAGGISEIIEDGNNGFIVRPGDREALKERILQLANSVELRKNMGEKALKIIKERYEMNKTIKQLDNVYQEILN